MFRIVNGDSLIELDKLEPNSIDSIVCDPPYEINFMNKGWDNSGIAYNVDLWKKCLNVLKSGGYLLAFGGSRTFHRMACAIEDAGFEIRDTIMWLYGCYSEYTQVLTNEGWKYFHELNKNEKIMQFDKDKNELSWVNPLNYFEYEIDDEMVLLENRHTSQLITKNHKVVCDIKKNHKQYKGKYDYIEAQNIKKADCVKLPLASYYYGKVNCEYAYMVGWWLTDAWIHNDKKACMFSQSKPNTLEKLRNELQRLKDLGLCNFSEYTKKNENPNHNTEHTFYVTGKLAEYLLNNYYNREIDYDVIEFNKESKEKLLEGLMDGDGSYRKEQYSRTFWSMNEKRNNVISALLTTMGYRNYIINKNNHGGVVFNIKHDSTELQFKHKKDNVLYHGKVYCLQTETGAFVVRRNGKPFISGNSGFPKSMNLSKGLEAREKLGNAGTRNKRKIEQACNSEEYTLKQTNNGAMGEIIEATRKEYIPDTDLAKKWQGWGTCLKPSYEPIIVARKPFKGSLVDNVIEYGVGGLNIDECRIGTEKVGGGTMPDLSYIGQEQKKNGNGRCMSFGQVSNAPRLECEEHIGRFPANTILTYDETDYDEVCGGFPNTKSSPESPNASHTFKGNKDAFEWGFKDRVVNASYNDSGNACRYFYSAKASKKDREEGLENLEDKVFNRMCEDANPNKPTGLNTDKKFAPIIRKNNHPCVKPTTLLQYLIKLVTPKGGIVLDPFMGSGSTGKAVAFENNERNANYSFIGIELSKDYCEIANARISWASNYQEIETNVEIGKDIKQNKKIDIFDFLGKE